MSVFWVDVEDTYGRKVGDGPLMTVSAWQHTAQLDRAGTFTFTMAADDPRRDLVRVKYIARCWTYAGGTIQHLGAGIINSMQASFTPDGAPTITVSGDDLLHELTYRTVGELALLDTVIAHPADVFYVPVDSVGDTTFANGDDLTDRTWLDYCNDNDVYDTTSQHELDWQMAVRWTVVKDPHMFRAMTWTVNPAHLNVLVPSSSPYLWVYYWSATEQWEPLTVETNHALLWGVPTYTMTWDIPSDWAIRDGEAGYKVCFRPAEFTNGVYVFDCAITYDRPSATALAQVLALAPTGWSLDVANGYASIARATELGDNLLTNSSFETYAGTQDNGVSDTFTDWTAAVLAGSALVEASATAQAGTNAVKITNQAVYDTGRIYQDVTVLPGTDYLLSFYNRGNGTRDGVFLVGTNGDNNNALTPFGGTKNKTTNWVEYRQELTTPVGVTSLRLNFYGPWYLYTGSTWWDNVSLRERLGGEVYLDFANESVLEALCRVAETTGEHFILSPSGRQVLWLRNDVRSTGVRCVANVDPQAVEDEPDLALIASLVEDQSAYDLVSRVYPFGGGTGAERATLAHATRGLPDGYTLDTTNNCLVRTAAETAYGRIDRRLDYPDVVALNDSPAQQQYASNMLFDRAYTYLRRHSATDLDPDTGDVPRTYTLTLAKCDRVLLPGYTVRVEYDRWAAQTRTLHIDRDLWVLSSTVRVDESGIHTTALQCSTTDVAPLSEAALLAELLRKQRAMAAHTPGA